MAGRHEDEPHPDGSGGHPAGGPNRPARKRHVFLDESALSLSGRHRVVRRPGTGLGLHTAYVDEPGTVDTAAVTDPLKGFAPDAPAAVARAATATKRTRRRWFPQARLRSRSSVPARLPRNGARASPFRSSAGT
ncbi:hypothetical protein SUDANB15_00369 [Streptomyces sp. enrichment culture]